MRDAVRLARQAIAEAEAAGEELALGQACKVLDWALVESGRAAEAGYSGRALEIFRRHGAVARESQVLNNMGGFAYRAGRWEEAVRLYRDAADAATRAGDAILAAFADCNVGELRSDQGRLDEAEPLLRRALQVWRGTGDEHGVAFATALLGRLHARAGDPEQAVALLDDALARFRELGVESDAALVEVLQAEAALFARRAEEARDRVLHLYEEVPQDALLGPLVHHLEGAALAQLGDAAGAREAFETSLAVARAAELSFETLLALDALHRLSGSDALRRERDALVGRLDIVRLPCPPLARSRTATAPVR